MLLALPLPWLARWLLPAVRSTSAALKVPYGERLDAIAHAGDARRAARAMAWLACAGVVRCCASPRRGRSNSGDVVQPPQAGRDLMLAVDLSGSMSEEDMQLGGALVDRLTAAKAVLADFLDRRVGDRVGLLVFGQTRVRADAADARPRIGARTAGRQRDRPGRARDRDRRRDRPRGQAPAHAAGRATRACDPADRRRQHRRRCSIRSRPRNSRATDGVRVHTIAFGGEGDAVGVRLPPARCRAQATRSTKPRCSAIAALTGGRFFRARDTAPLAGIYAEIDRLEPVRAPGPARASAHRALCLAAGRGAGLRRTGAAHGRAGGRA